MKQSLDLRHSQKLAMTPQMQQAVRLLQMSSVELSEEIQLAHETNPLLEMFEDSEISSDNHDLQQESSTDQTLDSMVEQPELEKLENNEDVAFEPLPQLEFNNVDNQSDVGWDDLQGLTPVDQRDQRDQIRVRNENYHSGDDNDYLLQIPEDQVTLREALGSQAIFLFNDEGHRQIAHHIIQNINEAGYLDVDLEDIRQQLSDQRNVSIEDIEAVLLVIQKLEPAGVAARSPEECLGNQLDAVDSNLPGYATARQIVSHHLGLLGSRDYAKLKKLLQVNEGELGHAVALITHLNPHPGYSFGNSRTDYIVPDILVEKRNGSWLARHNAQSLPKLMINQSYQQLISQGKGKGFGTLKEQLQDARWLLNNIEKRHQTILSVAREIVEKQQGFFHNGLEKMRPLTLNDIATPLGIHESTVSRATTGKYLLAPQGIFELKYFFSSQLSGDDGEAVSSLAVQTGIKKIIEAENSKKPVSDKKICALLSESGLKIARRTVAKYREMLNIPSSSRRKTL